MIICLYVDPVSTGIDNERAERLGLEDGAALEYKELENKIRDAFADYRRPILFKRNIESHQLTGNPCDFYVFDIGGLCAHDFNGLRRGMICRNIADAMKEMPSTGFVPWSTMTRSSMRAAIDDLVLGENCTEEPDDYQTPEYPNLFLPNRNDDHAFKINDPECIEWMKRFHSGS